MIKNEAIISYPILNAVNFLDYSVMNDLLANALFLRALKRQPVERTPVWMMRQAGRYLPEYRQTRAQAGDFLTLCKTPELACEVTLQPLRRYPLDAGILFSDILTIPDAMGLGLFFAEGEGPRFSKALQTALDIQQLPTTHVIDSLQYVFDAAALIRKEMPPHLPLIGFAGSPWTLACYMLEGGGSKHDFNKVLRLVYTEPKLLHQLLQKLTPIVIEYLVGQIESGVNALMVFDTWGGLLTKPYYLEFSLAYLQQIVSALKQRYPEVPVILFTKGGGQWLEEIADTGCDAISIDWKTDLASARQQVGEKVALQGNLDPMVLCTNPTIIRQEVAKVLSAYNGAPGHVFNLGHGITPDVPPEHVAVMIDAINAISQR